MSVPAKFQVAVQVSRGVFHLWYRDGEMASAAVGTLREASAGDPTGLVAVHDDAGITVFRRREITCIRLSNLEDVAKLLVPQIIDLEDLEEDDEEGDGTAASGRVN